MTNKRTDGLAVDDLMLTDGGLETVLVFHEGIDLPAFAAFPLLDSAEGRDALLRYHREFLTIAADAGAGYVHETPTWRANPAWGAEVGYSADGLRRIAFDSVAFGTSLRDEWSGTGGFLVSGCIGPRGDGYVPGTTMTPDQAAAYHRTQVGDLADAGVDLVTSFTLPYADEGTGLVAAAAEAGVPVVVGFTLETDGRLPSGESLGEAIEAVDAATGGYASWFMVNCAHPEHVLPALDGSAAWASRIGALRANASRMTHAELDEAEVLDDGDPDDLARGYVDLARLLPGLRVVGGCCGTDARHVAAIGAAMTRAAG
ncbi:homocysteine S-methyltransferase family protein [Longivirga aurantiaca]|uniref:Homocysteine S-methyltransferase family protein n=1 Tax=Longivirga aurantiaca TaxID=1837743 RepID=A0ABW1T4E0_9ACTN